MINDYNTFYNKGEHIVSKQYIIAKHNIDHKSFNERLKNEEEKRNCQLEKKYTP